MLIFVYHMLTTKIIWQVKEYSPWRWTLYIGHRLYLWITVVVDFVEVKWYRCEVFYECSIDNSFTVKGCGLEFSLTVLIFYINKTICQKQTSALYINKRKTTNMLDIYTFWTFSI